MGIMFFKFFFTICAITNFSSFAATLDFPVSIEWESVSPSQPIRFRHPASYNALSHQKSYLCRGSILDAWYPGSLNDNTCYVPFNSQVIGKTSFQVPVIPQEAVAWHKLPDTIRELVNRVVIGGSLHNGRNMYICRCYLFNEEPVTANGWYNPVTNACHIAHDGNVIVWKNSTELLVLSVFGVSILNSSKNGDDGHTFRSYLQLEEDTETSGIQRCRCTKMIHNHNSTHLQEQLEKAKELCGKDKQAYGILVSISLSINNSETETSGKKGFEKIGTGNDDHNLRTADVNKPQFLPNPYRRRCVCRADQEIFVYLRAIGIILLVVLVAFAIGFLMRFVIMKCRSRNQHTRLYNSDLQVGLKF